MGFVNTILGFAHSQIFVRVYCGNHYKLADFGRRLCYYIASIRLYAIERARGSNRYTPCGITYTFCFDAVRAF